MLVLAVNLGIHKGKQRAALVLDQYLPRVGCQVWAGYLSKEGCEEMVASLRHKASRSMAVQVIWLHDHRHDVIATIGNRKRFDEATAAIGKKSRSAKSKQPPAFVRQVILMARAAGAWHDVGKIMTTFQRTLQGRFRGKHTIRHQTLSFYLFRRLLKQPNFRKGNLDCPQIGAWRVDGSLTLEIVAAVILTHHAKAERNGHADRYCLPERRGFGTWAGGQTIAVDLTRLDENGRWLNDSLAVVHRLQVSNSEAIAPENHALAFYATRLAMMLADHAISVLEKTPNYEGRLDSKPEETTIYAKSEPWVPLTDHLANVSQAAGQAAYGLFMHTWSRVDRRPESLCRETSKRFRWQTRAEETIRQAGIQAQDGFFGAIIAETGSGKTQAGFRILSALSGGAPRFTLGVGFGALAIQSGVEYRKEIGLTVEEVAILVGHRHKTVLDPQMADADAIEFDLVHSTGREDSELPAVFLHGLRAAARKMLTTPIVVMTIDHIMAAMEADRGAYVAAASRLATADLLIDEIDSFSPSDLHAIARLVFLAASFGRKVVISSATMTPEIAGMLFEAYQHGYAQYQSAMGAGRLFTGVFANNGVMARVEMAPPNVAGNDSRNTWFHDVFAKVANSVTHCLNQRRHRRCMMRLPVDGIDCEESLFERLTRQALMFASRHHTVLPNWHGTWFSTGFIRFNMIRHAQRYATWLAERAPAFEAEYGIRIRLNCYTSALDTITRQFLERDLGRLLNRKNDDWSDLEVIRQFDADPKPTVYILSTTAIIEVGRDYDLDWGVLDPSSDMSIIQATGRVLRHRVLRLPETANVALLDKSVRVLLGEKGNAYGFPGPGFQQKDPLGLQWRPPWQDSDLKDRLAGELFGADIYAKGIHAGNRLTNPKTFADRMDRDLIRRVQDGPIGVRAFLSTENPWRDDAFDRVRFRHQDESGNVRKIEMRYRKNVHGWYDLNHPHAMPVKHRGIPMQDRLASLSLFRYPLIDGTHILVHQYAGSRLCFVESLGVVQESAS